MVRTAKSAPYLGNVGYMLIGVIPGFSLLLGAGLVVAVYGLFDPDFGFRWKRHGGQSYVS